MMIVEEMNKGEVVFSLADLAIKTSANKWATSKKQQEEGMGKNRWVDTANGEGLRLVDGSPSFAAIASYALIFFKRIKIFLQILRSLETDLDIFFPSHQGGNLIPQCLHLRRMAYALSLVRICFYSISLIGSVTEFSADLRQNLRIFACFYQINITYVSLQFENKVCKT